MKAGRRATTLLLTLACGGGAERPQVRNVATETIDPVVRLDRTRPTRDCPHGVAASVFPDANPAELTLDACLRGKTIVGDSVVVNVSHRAPNERIRARRAIVDLRGRILRTGTETITEGNNARPQVVALVDLDGDGNHEIVEEEELLRDQHVTHIYKVYEDSIVMLQTFAHALEDGGHTCTATWNVERRGRGHALVVSATHHPGSLHDDLVECLSNGRHELTLEEDRLVDR